MPSNIVLKSGFTIFLGTFIGYFGMHYIQNQNRNENNSLSLSSFSKETQIAKMGADQISKDYFDVRFGTNTIATKPNDPSKIVIKITAIKDIPAGLLYKWRLGSDMTSTDLLEGTLPNFTAGEEKSFEISAFGFSKESASHISFLISGRLGSHVVKREVIASSRPEDSYEYVVQQQALYEEKMAEFNQANPRNKLRKSNAKKGFGGKFDPEKIVR
jgi:hypothetical protein